MLVIEVAQHGGPDQLKPVDRPTPQPGPTELLVAHAAIGVNFVDLQHRAGTPFPDWGLPFVPGIEAAGVVVALGADVSEFQVGDRVAFTGMGLYAEASVVPADRVVRVPDDVSFEAAAGILMQGMTARCLTHDARPVAAGEWVLVHAAAGGVGRFVSAYVTSLGGQVIGVSSSAAKLPGILADGAVMAIDLATPDFVERVLARSDGCHVVYDSLGGPHFENNLRSLRASSDLILYGLAAGRVPPFDPGRLSGHFDRDLRGSLRVAWADVGQHTRTSTALRERAAAVFDDMRSGLLATRISATFPLAAAADAHRAMAAGPAGKVLLVP